MIGSRGGVHRAGRLAIRRSRWLDAQRDQQQTFKGIAATFKRDSAGPKCSAEGRVAARSQYSQTKEGTAHIKLTEVL